MTAMKNICDYLKPLGLPRDLLRGFVPLMKYSLVRLCLITAFTITLAGEGQPAATNIDALDTVRQCAFLSSLGDFSARNFSSAESTLEAANIAQPGTATWELESGSALLNVACYFVGLHNRSIAQEVALLALGHFEKGDGELGAGAANIVVGAERYQMGYICEWLLGDRILAMQYYTSAIAADSTNVQAGHAYKRLKKEVAAEESKP